MTVSSENNLQSERVMELFQSGYATVEIRLAEVRLMLEAIEVEAGGTISGRGVFRETAETWSLAKENFAKEYSLEEIAADLANMGDSNYRVVASWMLPSGANAKHLGTVATIEEGKKIGREKTRAAAMEKGGIVRRISFAVITGGYDSYTGLVRSVKLYGEDLA
jgi:hypothetical protein